MKIAIVFGTRPQYIKLAPLIEKLHGEFDLCTIDTGQHYDESLSRQFVSEFQMPKPTYVLNAGSGAFGRQFGAMLSRLLRRYSPRMAINLTGWAGRIGSRGCNDG